MLRLTVIRLAQAIPVLLVSSVIVFSVLQLAPGDPALLRAGAEATEEEIEAIREEFGLKKPLVTQYGIWLGKALRGDFGDSYINGQASSELIGNRVAASLELAVGATLVFIIGSHFLGVVAALGRGKRIDSAATSVSSAFVAIPNYWFGIVAILVFGLYLGWLPAGGRQGWSEGIWEGVRFLILPAIALAITATGTLARFVRTSMVETLSADYYRAATARGVGRWRRVSRYAFRNAAIPVVTVSGIFVARMLGGAVVIETVFGWPGLGRLLVQSIQNRDYNVVQAILLIMITLFIVVNLIVDMLLGALDPRLRRGAEGVRR